MTKMIGVVAGILVFFGLLWAARWVGVPRPWDINVVMLVALVVFAVERRRALRARYGRKESGFGNGAMP